MPVEPDPSAASVRDRIVDAAIAAFREGDLVTVDRQDVATRADVSVAEVDALFPAWSDLLVAVTGRWSVEVHTGLRRLGETEGAVAFLRALVERVNEDRPIVRMRMALLSAASDPEYGAGDWFQHIYEQFTRDITLFLTRDVILGREPRTMHPRHAAEQLIALYEGLQVQSILLNGVDLLVSWDRAVARMRTGWATPYEQDAAR